MLNALMAAEPARVSPSSVSPANASPLTINQILDAYCDECDNPYRERGRCKTAAAIRDSLKTIREVWGHLSFSEFSLGSKNRVKVQTQAWREAGLASGTCRKRLSQFKAALNYAYGEELVDKVPPFKLPKSGAPRERYVDPDKELPALLAAAEAPETYPHTRLCFHLSLRTGQRQGAIASLTWAHVDFEARVIRFRDTEAPEERSQKRRTDMPLDDALFALLSEAKARAKTEWVLEFRGKRAKNTTHSMVRLYQRAGIKGLTRHDLRRSAATFAFRAAGGDINVAANLLGDTPAIAAKHYAKSTAEDRRGSVEAIAGFIDAARSKVV